MDGMTEIEIKALRGLAIDANEWMTARMVADYAEVFRGMSNRSKAGAMGAVLKRLWKHGRVERSAHAGVSVYRAKH